MDCENNPWDSNFGKIVKQIPDIQSYQKEKQELVKLWKIFASKIVKRITTTWRRENAHTIHHNKKLMIPFFFCSYATPTMTSILNALYERITQPTGQEASPSQSHPFVKIVNGKLQLVGLDIPDEDIRVMSILGKARMGKSTFLNSIVSKIEGKSAQPFQTQDNDEHCTRGIDYYYCAEKKLVLMDCQGLALEDSSHDPALLLFAYLISDIIIFNERMMLQNEALKLLEPICTFMTYLDFDGLQKPKLYFRISDGDIVKDVQKNLQKIVHTQYNDQYQSIRDSIMNLFQTDIGIVKTESLDKQTKAKLQDGDYTVLLQEGLGFNDAVEELIQSLPKGRSAQQWKYAVPQFIEQINMNEKITIDKLDIVGQTGKLEILEWMNSLQTPQEPEVDGTQASYEKNVEPLKTLKKNLLTQFTRKFKAISDTIKEPHRQKLTERLSAPITSSTAKSVEKAEQRVKHRADEATRDQTFPEISTFTVSMTNTGTEFFDDYLAKFRMLKRAIDDIYEPVKTKYLSWLETQEATLQLAVEACQKSEAEDIANMATVSETTLEEFQVSKLLQISQLSSFTIHGKEKPLIYIHPEELTKALYEETIQEHQEQLATMFRPLRICPVMKNKVLKVQTFEKTEKTDKNDLVKSAFTKFSNELKEIVTGQVFLQAITARKIEILRGFKLSESIVRQIPDVPMVSFSRDHALLSSSYSSTNNNEIFLTADTYATSYEMLSIKTKETMTQKGFINENDELLEKTEQYKGLSNLTRQHWSSKKATISYLFQHTFAKVQAREYVKGFQIPKVWVE